MSFLFAVIKYRYSIVVVF